MSPPKRVKCGLTLSQKGEIIEKSSRGFSGKKLAQEYSVAQSTISYINKQKRDIMEQLHNSFDASKLKKKTLHKSENPEMEDQLYAWFLDQRKMNCPINGNILKAKACEIMKTRFHNEHFMASNGWFRNFKSRKGLRMIKVCGEKNSNDLDAVQPFVLRFQERIRNMGLHRKQIYNADESGLYYRLLPDRTYVSLDERNAPGLKTAKERITFMLCANSDGSHKLNPMVIGKSKNPRCFKNFDVPVEYTNSQNAWMTSYIFKRWFQNSFVRQVSRIAYANIDVSNLNVHTNRI